MAIDLQADAEAFSKQYDAEQMAEAAKKTSPPPTLWQKVSSAVGNVTVPALESVVNEAEQWGTAAKRVGQDVAAGGAQLVKNIGDTVVDATTKGEPADVAAQVTVHPWDHARKALDDFTDAVKVKDPNIVDVLTQYTAQVAPAYAVFARGLGFVGSRLKNLLAGAGADAVALPPDAPRFADLLQMAQHTDGKIGQALQAAGPYGLNAYINFLAHKGPESEAESKLKNALDGLMPNGLGNELLHAAMVTGRQGQRLIRTAVDNGLGSLGDLGPPSGSRAAQRGSIGVQNNASGESAASQEAVNRVAQEKEAGITRHVLRADDTVEPLMGVDAVDAKAQPGDVIVQMHKGKPTILDRGGLPQAHANGRVNRALANGLIAGEK